MLLILPFPKACHKVNAIQEDAIMAKLLEANMTALVPEEVIPTKPNVLAAVHRHRNRRRKHLVQRVIFDRRP